MSSFCKRAATSIEVSSAVGRRAALADMYGHAEIHFVGMFDIMFFNYSMPDYGFRDIIHDHPRPYLLLDTGRLIGMEIAKPDCIFQLAEGRLDDVGHVVVGAVTAIPNIDVFYTKENWMVVNDSTERKEFIFSVYGLRECVRERPTVMMRLAIF